MVVVIGLLAGLVAGAVELRNRRIESAIRGCILATPEGQAIPELAGEPLLTVDVVDLVVWRRTETSRPTGVGGEALARTIRACRDAA